MKAFKFTIPALGFRTLTSDPNVAFAGCAAVVVAESEAEARDEIRRFAEANDCDARWIEIADVTPMEIDVPRVLTFVMF